ncbi:hypothetical protein SAMN04488107_3484 [Geodermatophilus saharensis]|uniref:Uncharacterized protein n=1 Tax=Geodermatophilus saharensis TaxID=1137994 RepID=A0A239GM80_9ACTN|nr:hypothetical protein [Geodermatophilus saharensis]SNS70230.1 hypothetical protein SAMN04488107_3484 [Geodermatophilus saharensis]
MPRLPIGGDGEVPADVGATGCVEINFRTEEQVFPQGGRVVVEGVAVTGADHVRAGGSACADRDTVSCTGFVFEDGSESCGVDVEVLTGAVVGETGDIELSGHLDCSSAGDLDSCLAVGAALNEDPPTGSVTVIEPVQPG